jgi:hypothetical protein
MCYDPNGVPSCAAVSPSSAPLDSSIRVWVSVTGLFFGFQVDNSSSKNITRLRFSSIKNVTQLRFGTAVPVTVSVNLGDGWLGAIVPPATVPGLVDAYALLASGHSVCAFSFVYLPRPAQLFPSVLPPTGGFISSRVKDHTAAIAGSKCSVLFAGRQAADGRVDSASGWANATAPAAPAGAAAAVRLKCAAGGGRAAREVDLGAYVEYRRLPRATATTVGSSSIASCWVREQCSMTVVIDDPPDALVLSRSDLRVLAVSPVDEVLEPLMGAAVTIVKASSHRLIFILLLPPASVSAAGQLVLTLIPAALVSVGGQTMSASVTMAINVLPPAPRVERIWPTSASQAAETRVLVRLAGLSFPPSTTFVAAMAVGEAPALSASMILPDMDGGGGAELAFILPQATLSASIGLRELMVMVSWPTNRSNNSINFNSSSNSSSIILGANGYGEVSRLSAPFLVTSPSASIACMTGCEAAAAGPKQKASFTVQTVGPALGGGSSGGGGAELALDCVLAAAPTARNQYCFTSMPVVFIFAGPCTDAMQGSSLAING